MSGQQYIETNRVILQRIYLELRWAILETKMCLKSDDPIEGVVASMFFMNSEDNPNYDEMVERLEAPVRFDGPECEIKQNNYYVVKHRLTKFNRDIVENEIRAGWFFVLVKKVDDVAVSYFYAHEGADLSTLESTKKWVKWQHTDEAWIIYDPNDGHIHGNYWGSVMD